MFGQGLQRLCVATSEMCVFISIVNVRLDYVLLFIGFWHFCMVRVTLLWHAQSNNVFYIFTWTMVFIKTVLVRERIKKQKQNILVLKNTVYKCVFTSFIYFSPYQLMSLIAETYSCSFYTQGKKTHSCNVSLETMWELFVYRLGKCVWVGATKVTKGRRCCVLACWRKKNKGFTLHLRASC